MFPAPRGGVLDTHNFLNRVWQPVVNALVEAGKVQQYLPQYNARHTFITLMLDAGVEYSLPLLLCLLLRLVNICPTSLR